MTPSLHKEQPVENLRILAFVGMLKRPFRSGNITLEGAVAFVVPPSKRSLYLIHYVASCPFFLVVSAYFPVAQPHSSLPSFCLASLFRPPHHIPECSCYISTACAKPQCPSLPLQLRTITFRSYGVTGIMTCGRGH